MGAPLRGKRHADETRAKLGKERVSKKPKHEDLCVDEVMLDVVEEEKARREMYKRGTRSNHDYAPPEKKLRLETWENQRDGTHLRWPLEGKKRVGNHVLHLERQVVDLQSQLECEKVACNSLREQLDLRAVAEMELRERAGMAEACAMETERALDGLKQEHQKLQMEVDRLNNECETEKEKTLCCICYEKNKNILMLPCQHLIACRDCALRIQAESNRCPTCREPIEMIMECFW